MKTVKFGLMARKFASAAARWFHLMGDIPKPEIVGICSVVPQEMDWFKKNFPEIEYAVTDYKELLDKEDIDAIYCAVPHNLHEQFYIDIIKSGKALLGEKPFGIDKKANENIMKAIEENPDTFVRCCSEFPYYPAMQTMINWFNEVKFGKILEIHCGFNHCSDMDTTKPINWKRMGPGSTNHWFFEIYGMDCSAKFSSDDANAFHYTSSWGKEQSWNRIIIGYKPMIPTVTGPIFEFGFTDALKSFYNKTVEVID